MLETAQLTGAKGCNHNGPLLINNQQWTNTGINSLDFPLDGQTSKHGKEPTMKHPVETSHYMEQWNQIREIIGSNNNSSQQQQNNQTKTKQTNNQSQSHQLHSDSVC